MNAMTRLKTDAELVAGKRDGKRVDYRKFDESEWKGDRAQWKPADLFYREESGEVALPPADMAKEVLRLIDHVRETAETLTDLINALPVHDAPGRVLKGEIQDALHDLTDRFVS